MDPKACGERWMASESGYVREDVCGICLCELLSGLPIDMTVELLYRQRFSQNKSGKEF